ncbi:MAG TPA: shikimate dehydrogenase, partial [Candidatus Gallibacteroides avistercoris]|nr:shikimate dehydrogenase [Candidatus Gallibacteroides avistercoris]
MKAIYGLLGYPLGHSFSKMYFNEKFQSENILAEYRNFEIEDISLIREVVLTEPNLCGL